VPLGHCSVCDTYYPRRLGGCRWCGTKASTFPTRLLTVAVGVVLAVCVVGVGVWQYRSRTRPAEQGAEQEARATMSVSPALAAQVTPRVDSSMGGAIVPLDSAADRAAAPAGSLRGDVAVAAPSPTAVTAVEAPAQPQALPDSVQRALERAARLTAPYSGPWTRAVAQSWVNVRAAASLSAAIVGVVTPNTRVELGDSRGAWRRVRSAGFQGWADGAFFDADTSGR